MVLDTETIRQSLRRPGAPVFEFAKDVLRVKANRRWKISTCWRDKARVRLASIYELGQGHVRGVGPTHQLRQPPSRSQGHSATSTRRAVRHVRHPTRKADLAQLAKAAPGSKVYVRILHRGSTTADWPLRASSGLQTDMAIGLLHPCSS